MAKESRKMQSSEEASSMTEENAASAASNSETQEAMLGANRIHFENLGNAWAAVVGNPEALMPQIVGTVLHSGGTRPAWQHSSKGMEYVLMAWPADQPARAAVIMRGEEGKEMKPASAVPLLEGLPNDLTVAGVHPWHSGVEANVAVSVFEGGNPMWFYSPTYFRDAQDLTEGVTHTFLLSGLAFGVRRALVDELTITQGPQYEMYAEEWLAANPEKRRLDVPPLKISLRNKKIIMPGRVFGEYQLRTTVLAVESCQLEKENMTMLRVAFDMPAEAPALNVMLYVPARVLGEYEPKVGDEIDAYVWLQGRIIDFDPEAEEPAVQ